MLPSVCHLQRVVVHRCWSTSLMCGAQLPEPAAEEACCLLDATETLLLALFNLLATQRVVTSALSEGRWGEVHLNANNDARRLNMSRYARHSPLFIFIATTVVWLSPTTVCAQPWKAAARHLHQSRAQSLLSTSWTPSTFPNPTHDTDRCNRHGVTSWMCDPDNVVAYNTANVVEAILQDIQAGKSPYALAPCGALGKQGFQVAVALLRKMQTDAEPSDAAKSFAKELHGRWGVGLRECNNGVLLLLAVEDRQVYISTGSGARKALSDAQASIIIDRMKPALRAGDYDQAVERAVREVGLTLAGAKFAEPIDWVTTLYASGVAAFVVWVFATGIRCVYLQRC